MLAKVFPHISLIYESNNHNCHMSLALSKFSSTTDATIKQFPWGFTRGFYVLYRSLKGRETKTKQKQRENIVYAKSLQRPLPKSLMPLREALFRNISMALEKPTEEPLFSPRSTETFSIGFIWNPNYHLSLQLFQRWSVSSFCAVPRPLLSEMLKLFYTTFDDQVNRIKIKMR